MNRLKRPDVWFLVTLVVITAVGAVLLAQTSAVQPDAQHLSYRRHYWQAAFDALSATCGVGLLTYDFEEDYTPQGRWILTAFGVLGAMLFLGAITHALRRIKALDPSGETPEPHLHPQRRDAGATPTREAHATVPHPLLVVGAFLVAGTLAVGVFVLARQLGESGADAGSAKHVGQVESSRPALLSTTAGGTPTLPTAGGTPTLPTPQGFAVQRAIAAFSSLGWASEPCQGGAAERQVSKTRPALRPWPLALLAWIGALGWPLWLIVVPSLLRKYVRYRNVLAMLGGYVVTLLVAALLISVFESPRGTGLLGDRSLTDRYTHSLVQTVAASGAGMPTMQSGGAELEPCATHYPLRNVSDGTKFTLSALVLVGGLGGSATGGVQWPLLLWALAGGAAALGWTRRAGRALDPPVALPVGSLRWMHAGLACLFLLASLALVVALGLLLIENWTASRFQPPPTFADALLDACSVVAGGNLSSGLTEAVTSRNLIGGIRQSANLYQYGMTWLMLAMLAGRVLPLVVLRRLGDTRPRDTQLRTQGST